MLRGRRVVLCAIFIFQFSIFLSVFSRKASAQTATVSITATVALSPVWKQAIMQNSTVQFESQSFSLNTPVKMIITAKGYDNQSLPDQSIRISVFENDRQIENNIVTTNNNGVIGYAFVPSQYGDYYVTAENITYQTPLLFSSKQFSVKNPDDFSILNSFVTIFSRF